MKKCASNYWNSIENILNTCLGITVYPAFHYIDNGLYHLIPRNRYGGKIDLLGNRSVVETNHTRNFPIYITIILNKGRCQSIVCTENSARFICGYLYSCLVSFFIVPTPSGKHSSLRQHREKTVYSLSIPVVFRRSLKYGN